MNNKHKMTTEYTGIPGIFLEYKNSVQSDHWIHVQLSTSNELVLERLGIDMNGKGVIQWVKKQLARRLLMAHANIHSEDADGYILNLEKIDNGADILHSKREKKKTLLVP
jgi:hypothetical protein